MGCTNSKVAGERSAPQSYRRGIFVDPASTPPAAMLGPGAGSPSQTRTIFVAVDGPAEQLPSSLTNPTPATGGRPPRGLCGSGRPSQHEQRSQRQHRRESNGSDMPLDFAAKPLMGSATVRASGTKAVGRPRKGGDGGAASSGEYGPPLFYVVDLEDAEESFRVPSTSADDYQAPLSLKANDQTHSSAYRSRGGGGRRVAHCHNPYLRSSFSSAPHASAMEAAALDSRGGGGAGGSGEGSSNRLLHGSRRKVGIAVDPSSQLEPHNNHHNQHHFGPHDRRPSALLVSGAASPASYYKPPTTAFTAGSAQQSCYFMYAESSEDVIRAPREDASFAETRVEDDDRHHMDGGDGEEAFEDFTEEIPEEDVDDESEAESVVASEKGLATAVPLAPVKGADPFAQSDNKTMGISQCTQGTSTCMTCIALPPAACGVAVMPLRAGGSSSVVGNINLVADALQTPPLAKDGDGGTPSPHASSHRRHRQVQPAGAIVPDAEGHQHNSPLGSIHKRHRLGTATATATAGNSDAHCGVVCTESPFSSAHRRHRIVADYNNNTMTSSYHLYHPPNKAPSNEDPLAGTFGSSIAATNSRLFYNSANSRLVVRSGQHDGGAVSLLRRVPSVSRLDETNLALHNKAMHLQGLALDGYAVSGMGRVSPPPMPIAVPRSEADATDIHEGQLQAADHGDRLMASNSAAHCLCAITVGGGDGLMTSSAGPSALLGSGGGGLHTCSASIAGGIGSAAGFMPSQSMQQLTMPAVAGRALPIVYLTKARLASIRGWLAEVSLPPVGEEIPLLLAPDLRAASTLSTASHVASGEGPSPAGAVVSRSVAMGDDAFGGSCRGHVAAGGYLAAAPFLAAPLASGGGPVACSVKSSAATLPSNEPSYARNHNAPPAVAIVLGALVQQGGGWGSRDDGLSDPCRISTDSAGYAPYAVTAKVGTTAPEHSVLHV